LTVFDSAMVAFCLTRSLATADHSARCLYFSWYLCGFSSTCTASWKAFDGLDPASVGWR